MSEIPAKLTKVDHWIEPFNKYIHEAQKREFEWGTFDCCIFAADIVRIQTGWDPMEEFRDTYTDRESSLTTRKKRAKTTNLYKILCKKLGEPVHGVKGRQGDIAFFDGVCGVILGKFGLFLHEEGGFGFVKITAIRKAFKVGW